MNLDLLFAIIFFVILYGIYFLYKNKFETQGIFVMYKTKLGLKLMDKISKKDEIKFILKLGIFISTLGLFTLILGGILHSSSLLIIGAMILGIGMLLAIPLRWLSYVGIFLGYAGMAFIFYFLVKGIWDLVFLPSAPPVVSPVLPGIQIAPGIPILSFWHWIIGILIIATIHEFSHGIYARLHKIKIKSSGFAFIGPLLAAFVEPDEKQMNRKKKRYQLNVLMAGPFSNIITGFIFLGGFLLLGMLVSGGMQLEGIEIASMEEGFPVMDSGLEVGDIVTKIDGIDIVNVTQVRSLMQLHSPGDEILLGNSNEEWVVQTVANSENVSASKIGISFLGYYGENLGAGRVVGVWFVELFFWLWVISFGVGLFNLLPLGPVDGGKMFYIGMLFIFKNEKKAEKIWKAVSFLCLALILINLLPWIIKLFAWILGL